MDVKLCVGQIWEELRRWWDVVLLHSLYLTAEEGRPTGSRHNACRCLSTRLCALVGRRMLRPPDCVAVLFSPDLLRFEIIHFFNWRHWVCFFLMDHRLWLRRGHLSSFLPFGTRPLEWMPILLQSMRQCVTWSRHPHWFIHHCQAVLGWGPFKCHWVPFPLFFLHVFY